MKTKTWFASAVLSMVVSGCGVSDSTTSADEQGVADQELVAGQIDALRTWSVGVCQGAYNTDPALGPVGTCRGGTAKCTGTLVGPNLVLTARHCVQAVDYGPGALTGANPCDATFNTSPLAPGGTHVTTSPSVYVGTPTWYEVAEVRVPSSNNMCADDLALLVLASNVPAREARPVGIDANRDLARRPPAAVAVVGRGALSDQFGLDANGDWNGVWNTDQGDLSRRVQQNIPFVCASNGPSGCAVVSHEVPTTHVFPTPLNWYVIGGDSLASGDSGSGLFDQRRFNRIGRARRVIGVNAWTFISPTGAASPNAGVRLDGFKEFLRDGVRYAAQVGGYGGGCNVDEIDSD